MRKVLSFILAIVMVISLIPVAVFAEGGNAIKESVEKCRQIATEYTIDSVARKTLSLYHQVIREQQ